MGFIFGSYFPFGDMLIVGHSVMHVVKSVAHKTRSGCDLNTMEMFEKLTTLFIIIFATTRGLTGMVAGEMMAAAASFRCT